MLAWHAEREACLTLSRLILCALAAAASVAAQPAVTAPIQPLAARRPAAEFALKDKTGKTVSLKKYGGKLVLLDFWPLGATAAKKKSDGSPNSSAPPRAFV